MIDNGDMAVLDAGSNVGIANWEGTGSTGYHQSTLGPYNAILMQPTGGSGPLRTVGCRPLSKAPVYGGDTFSLSFLLDGQATISSLPKCFLTITLTHSGTDYYMDEAGNWSTTVGKISVMGTTTSTYETKSYTAQVLPYSGTLNIFWQCDNFDTEVSTVANSVLTFSSPYQYRLGRNGITDLSYQKLVDVSMGGACDDFAYNQIGSLVQSDGTPWTGWYRYDTPATTYTMLLDLIYQQYYNIVTVSSVNIEGNIRKVLPGSSIIPCQQMTQFIISDPTGTISVTGKKYLIGNSSFDHVDDSIQNVTLLETSNTDLTITDYTDRTIPKA